MLAWHVVHTAPTYISRFAGSAGRLHPAGGWLHAEFSQLQRAFTTRL